MTDIVLQTTPRDDHIRVTVVGALAAADARAIRHQLRRLIDLTTPPQLVLDLSCCTNIDTHGILTLTAVHHAVTARGGTLTLTDVPPLIRYRLDHHPQAAPLRTRE